MLTETQYSQFFDLIDTSQNVLILNPKPDGDSIGASLALQKILKKLKKNVLSQSCFPIPDYLRFVVERGDIIVDDLKSEEIDHIDLVILVDSCEAYRCTNNPALVFSPKTKFLCIDHHKNTDTGELNLFINDDTAESTCGLITDLCIDYKVTHEKDLIDTEVAFLLFAGIVADTDYFGYANVTTDTFERAAYLKQYNFDSIPIILQFRESLGLKAFKFIQNNIQRVVVNEKKRYAYLKVKKQDINFDENILVVNEAVNYINRALIRIIDCVDFSFIIREVNQTRSSLAMRRHNNGNNTNLSQITKKFGGGGHQQSAGALVDMSVDELEKKLITYLDTLP